VLPAGGTLLGMDVGVPGKVESVGALILLGLVLELPELGSLGLAFVPGTVVPEGVVSVPEGVVPEGVVPEGVVPEGVVPEGVVPEGMLVLSGVVVPDGVVVSAPEGFVMLVPLVGFFLPLAAGVVVFFFLVVWAVFPAKVET
jgi:hypothetical protein